MSAILADANYSSQNFEVAKAVLRGLAKTTGEWSMVNKEGEGGNVGRRWGISSLLAQAELIDDGSSITFEWSSGWASFFYFTMTPAPHFAGLRRSPIQQVYQ